MQWVFVNGGDDGEALPKSLILYISMSYGSQRKNCAEDAPFYIIRE